MLRLLLDAHVSGRVMATALAKRGHDVRALTDEPALEGLDDEDVLRLAVEQDRILVTYDVKDFPPLLRAWAEAGRGHAGCDVVHGLDHREFGRLLRGLDCLFTARPAHEEWRNLAVFLSRAGTG
jgi:NAD(P)-dependent dehydrogenase (short-subunit alcohol dehydrogenase family)